jgi:hypothetical protein
MATAAAAAVALAPFLAGCATGGVNTTCEEFMTKSSDEQSALISEWNEDVMGENAELNDAAGDLFLQDFVEYCGQAGHEDDKLKDLTFTARPASPPQPADAAQRPVRT